jgi:macrolide transport system ATP-binding/permease protein
MLANMGFDAAMVSKQAGKLSLGERNRVKLAAMILQVNDLLILDEPTNHLDLHSREKLEQTLLDYTGTLLIVSHDRYMLERVCDKLLVFEDQTIKKLECRFGEYRNTKDSKATEKHHGSQEEKLVIETRMAWLVSELGKLTPEAPEYAELDREFRELAKKKRELDSTC